MPDPSPRSLVLDLLATVGRAAAPVSALVSAGRIFGVPEGTLRVTLTRLVADGLVERDARGRYRLGPRAAGVSAEIRGWREIETRRVRWSGAWVAAHTSGLARGRARTRRERARALRLLGFRPLAPGLELRPDNLEGGVAGVRERLLRLGVGPEVPVFGLSELDEATETRALSLWEGRALVAAYRATRARLEQSAARLPDLPRDAAMVETFRLGGAGIRQIALDPLLPDPIVPAAERRALVSAMRRYDRLGRSVWRGWFDGAESELPAGVRGGRAGEEPWRTPERRAS